MSEYAELEVREHLEYDMSQNKHKSKKGEKRKRWQAKKKLKAMGGEIKSCKEEFDWQIAQP